MATQIIAAIIAIAVPILFSLLVAKYPNFPLNLESVTSLVVWFAGLFIAGAKLRDAQMLYKYKKDQSQKPYYRTK